MSTRTVERDLAALQQSGVPIYAEPGRTGGYVLDKRMSLPPVNFTPQEAAAIAVALAAGESTPFHGPTRTALRKVLAAMPQAVRHGRDRPAGPGHPYAGSRVEAPT